MNEVILEQLLVTQGEVCISVILPMHKTGSERMLNQLIIDKAIRKAKSALKRVAPDAGVLAARLQRLAEKAHINKGAESIGIFVSTEIGELVCFPFKVKEKVVIDERFEIRDLHYLRQFMAPYYTLFISSRYIHLYFSQGSHLDEIHDGVFPMKYQDEYEYERSAAVSGFGYGRKAYEPDKSSMTKLRVEAFYREAISHLQSYLKNPEIPLVVAGTHEDLAAFGRLNDINDSIAAHVYGAFKDSTLTTAAEKAWVSLRNYRKAREEAIITRFREKATPNRIAKGIQEVWVAALEGRGKLLLVEKDYHCKSYLKDGETTLYLRPPKGKYTIEPDAVDYIIETIIEKGGKVLFAGQGSLRGFDSIALELRY